MSLLTNDHAENLRCAIRKLEELLGERRLRAFGFRYAAVNLMDEAELHEHCTALTELARQFGPQNFLAQALKARPSGPSLPSTSDEEVTLD